MSVTVLKLNKKLGNNVLLVKGTSSQPLCIELLLLLTSLHLGQNRTEVLLLLLLLVVVVVVVVVVEVEVERSVFSVFIACQMSGLI
jgi:hypothetical protein